jgi:peroxiredoxin
MARTRGCLLAAMLLLGGSRIFGQAPAAKPAEADLQSEFTKAVKVFMEEYRAADANAREKLLADPAREPRHRFTPQFLAAAQRHKGTPEAIPYWAWLVENGTIVDAQVGEQAVTRLLSDHLADPGLAPGAKAVGRAAGVRGLERTIADLTRIVEGSPHAPVRAEALFQRGFLRREAGSPEALKDFQRAAAEAPDSAPGKRAAETLAASRPLAIGDQAPDFEGHTLAGDSVKLSALRGRIVLVDFWGLWCGPCVAQLPKIRKIHERFRGMPFEVIGIDSDKDLETLRRFLAANHVDWTTVLDRATDGPIATAWRVGDWPSTFLIDETGVIRARNLALDVLEATIAGMLKKR